MLSRGIQTALLVDQEPTVIQVARAILERAGYLVLDTATESEALELSRRPGLSIDLMLTDVVEERNSSVPDILLFHPAMRVIYMSAYAPDHAAVERLRRDGATILQKPFTYHTLIMAAAPARPLAATA